MVTTGKSPYHRERENKRMKKLAALFALLLLASSACTPNVKPQNTPEPTAEITAAPTDVPTEAPTAAPTDVPTEAPTAAPVFPTPGGMGNLLNGEAVLPDGMKYFVLDGESGIRYVYDRCGELVTTFRATASFNCWSNSPGIYGEYGVPYGYCIKRGEPMPENCITFANRVFEFKKIWEDEEGYSDFSEYYGFVLTAMWDEGLERRITFEPNGPIGLGASGGVLPVDGGIIVIASRVSEENGEQLSVTEGKVLDENGEYIGEFDPAPFGGFDKIEGVLGKKYLLVNAGVEQHPMESGDWSSYMKYDVYTLSGECVMTDCWASAYAWGRFHYWDGIGRGFLYADHCVTRSGEVLDGELNTLFTLEEGTDLHNTDIMSFEQTSILHEFYNCPYKVVQNGVYAGVKDEKGNWVFRIYDPRLANDSQGVSEGFDEFHD